MKALAIFMIVLCLAALGGVGYMLVTSNLDTSSVSCVVIELKDDPALFEKLKTQLEQGSFTGTRFSGETLTSADEYLVYTWTVRVENRTALPARVAEIQVLPMRGYDILQFNMNTILYGNIPEYNVRPNGTTDMTVSVLTSRAILNASSRPDIRDATLSWYFSGFPFPETNGKGGKLVLRP